MKTALITGGSGFVGHWMQKTQPPEIFCLYLNRAEYHSLEWQNHIWDYIIHLAPISPGQVIAQIKRYGGRLLYCSSGAVYHDNPTEYGLNKRRWEYECERSGINFVTARLFSFYGEKLDSGKALSQFLRAGQYGLPIYIHADGNTVRSYMSGAEMGRWMWAILLRGERGEAYDVGSDEPVTMLQLARWIVKMSGYEIPIIIQNHPDPVPVYLPRDTAKTRRLLDV